MTNPDPVDVASPNRARSPVQHPDMSGETQGCCTLTTHHLLQRNSRHTHSQTKTHATHTYAHTATIKTNKQQNSQDEPPAIGRIRTHDGIALAIASASDGGDAGAARAWAMLPPPDSSLVTNWDVAAATTAAAARKRVPAVVPWLLLPNTCAIAAAWRRSGVEVAVTARRETRRLAERVHCLTSAPTVGRIFQVARVVAIANCALGDQLKVVVVPRFRGEVTHTLRTSTNICTHGQGAKTNATLAYACGFSRSLGLSVSSLWFLALDLSPSPWLRPCSRRRC